MGMAEILALAANSRRVLHNVTISYARGDSEPITLIVSIGQTKWEAVDNDGNVLRLESRDYLFPAAELIFDDEVVEPARGDLITEGAIVQEVLPVSDEQVFRYTDPFRQELRVHSQRKT